MIEDEDRAATLLSITKESAIFLLNLSHNANHCSLQILCIVRGMRTLQIRPDPPTCYILS